MNRLTLYARAILLRLAFGNTRPANTESRFIESRVGEINDGLTYAQPTLLPGYMREALEQHEGALEKYLKESAANGLNFQFDTPAVRDPQYIGAVEDSLMEWDAATRMYVLSNTHAAYHRNPLAMRCVHYISAFTVGAGFNLHCKNKDVEKVLQEFIDDPDNAFREYERQAVRDLVVDGELFLRFFVGDGSEEEGTQVVAVPIRPWEIDYIHTQTGFFRRVIFYHYQPYGGQHNRSDPNAQEPIAAEEIKAGEVIHVAINKHAYEQRGRPELYPALPWLKAHKDWLENRARQNAYRGSLLWWVKIKNALPGVIAQKIAQYSRPFKPGSIAVTTDNEEFQALTNPVGAGDAGEDGRQLKIMAQNGIGGLPEYMTGDGANANLATTKSQQLPALTTFKEFQTIMIEQVLTPTFRRVLEAKIAANELPAMVEEQDSDGDPVMLDAEPEGEEGYEPDVMSDPAKPEAKLAAAIKEAEAANELVLKIAQKDAKPGEPGADGKQPGDAPPVPPALQKPPAPPPKQVKAPKIDALTAFTVDYEPLDQDAPKDLADALAIAEDHEWISQQEATTRFGADYTMMQKQRKLEKAAKQARIAQGLEPEPMGAIPPGLGGDPEEMFNAKQ